MGSSGLCDDESGREMISRYLDRIGPKPKKGKDGKSKIEAGVMGGGSESSETSTESDKESSDKESSDKESSDKSGSGSGSGSGSDSSSSSGNVPGAPSCSSTSTAPSQSASDKGSSLLPKLQPTTGSGGSSGGGGMKVSNRVFPESEQGIK